jgi:hypothetical protein
MSKEWRKPLHFNKIGRSLRSGSGANLFLSLCPSSGSTYYEGRGVKLEEILAEFVRYCNDKFHLWDKTHRLNDVRRKPEIPLGRIVLLMICALALGKKSFHQMDTFARQRATRRWLVSDRRMVASDSTLERVLSDVNAEEVRETLAESYHLLRQEGHGRVDLGEGKRLRVGVVDGSVLCGRYCGGFEVIGKSAALIDAEPSEGRGNELAASERLIRRVFVRHGKGFVDLVAYDGLGITQGMLRLVKDECGCDLLIKTKELDSLSILKDAEGIFQACERSPDRLWKGVEHVTGMDLTREYAYAIWAGRGFHHAGYARELKVARVRITPVKSSRQGQMETFWVITTAVDLSAEQLREVAHLRWSIENHGWRALSAQMKTKHQWMRPDAPETLFLVVLLLMLLTFTLMMAFHARLSSERIWKAFGLRKITIAFMVECWVLSLPSAPAWSPGDG